MTPRTATQISHLVSAKRHWVSFPRIWRSLLPHRTRKRLTIRHAAWILTKYNVRRSTGLILVPFRLFVFSSFVLSSFRPFVLSSFRPFVLSSFRLSSFRLFVFSSFRLFVFSSFRLFVFSSLSLSLSLSAGADRDRAKSETGLSSPVPDQQRSSSCFLCVPLVSQQHISHLFA